MDSKKWTQSKTILINGAVTLAGVLTMALQYADVITAVAPQVAPVVTFFAALNIFLRTVTKTAVTA